MDVWPPPPQVPIPQLPPPDVASRRRSSPTRWAARALSGVLLPAACALAAYNWGRGTSPAAVAAWSVLALLGAVTLLLSWRRD